ncbi:MAG: SMI1/KNR4 family protein [Bdellovibrionales bacterium]
MKNSVVVKLPWLPIVIRLLFALCLLLCAGSLGFRHRNFMIIFPLGLAFTVLYIGGKWHLWRAILNSRKQTVIIKNLCITLPIQIFLAGLVYLIGLGLGRIFTTHSFVTSVTKEDLLLILILVSVGLIVLVFVNWLEGGVGPIAYQLNQDRGAHSPEKSDPYDFKVLSEPVTKNNLFSSYRGSQDYTFTALTRAVETNDDKPKREPFSATETMIASTEERLGFVLPEGLKELYRFKNGGYVPNIFVPKVADPAPLHDHWENAFGGYENLYSLKSLRTVYDSILDFAYEDDTEAFPEGSEKLLILAQWYQQTTFLDYRYEGEPKVGIADFDDENWEDHALWFKNFDEFFLEFKRIDLDFDRKVRPKELMSKGPVVSNRNKFWLYYGDTSDHGVNEQVWKTTEDKLQVSLPLELKPYLEISNGGSPYYNKSVAMKGGMDLDFKKGVFPGGRLLGVHRWVSLEELSGRLDFVHGLPMWSEIWKGADKLIVISAKFDSALMLDYRLEREPRVIYAPNLDEPENILSLGKVKSFLESLRAEKEPHWQGAPIGDESLSPRSLSLDCFWVLERCQKIDAQTIENYEKLWECKLPAKLKEWMLVHDGGTVRFRYLPPVKPNLYGHLNPTPEVETWVDILPDGILPIEKWALLEDWRREHAEGFGEALRQRGYAQYVKEEFGDLKKILVLAVGQKRLTLLDFSRSNNVADHSSLVQIVKTPTGWMEGYRSAVFRALRLRAKHKELV